MNLSRKTFLRTTALAAVAAGAGLVLAGCAVTVPTGVRPVTGFDAKRYMGDWYELARIDNRFEKGLTKASANYSLNADGTVKVINRGYDVAKDEWRQVEGTARFLQEPNVAALKVSFFGPFYGGYNVVSLDDNYQTALVVGGNSDYFWLLSRKKQIPQDELKALLNKAQELGVDLSRVMIVNQE